MRRILNSGRTALCAALFTLALGGLTSSATAAEITRPVFRVDAARPTQDKPQAKLWFAQGSWWAWLPVQGGSSVWKRNAEGWRRQTHLDSALQGLPGQADVWADADSATAVLVAPDQLAVVSLRWDATSRRYELAAAPATLAKYPKQRREEGIETATIARDSRGLWWVAYNWQREMLVRHSLDTSVRAWSDPIVVSTAKANADDICAIAALPGSVAVVWSDQDHDAVYFRQHEDGAPPESWKAIEIADSGGHTADDHLNMVVASDGTLYITTKNSVDAMGKPQLVLRIRDPKGKWTNLPYAPRTKAGEPSRPIVLLTPGDSRLLLLHTIYRVDDVTPRHDVIAWQSTPREPLDLAGPARVLIDSGTIVNNVTGTKSALAAGEPWVVLASSTDGEIFEALLN